MRYEEIKDWKDTDFRRPPKLSRADQLLMTLMYWREYRAQFHIAGSYGISEAMVCRTINKIEGALVRSGEFRLPGQKALQPSDTLIEVVLVDVNGQPVERPKKSKNDTTAAKRSVIPRKHRFRLFKESRTVMAYQVLCLADAGYQGF